MHLIIEIDLTDHRLGAAIPNANSHRHIAVDALESILHSIGTGAIGFTATTCAVVELPDGFAVGHLRVRDALAP